MAQIQSLEAAIFSTAIKAISSLPNDGETADLRNEGKALANGLASLRSANAKAPLSSPIPEEVLKAVTQAGQMCQHYLDHKQDSKIKIPIPYLQSSISHYILMTKVLRAVIRLEIQLNQTIHLN